MKAKKDDIPQMNTMTDCVNSLAIKGYTESFRATKSGLKALSDETIYSSSDVSIANFYRFEGQSDPSDNAIIYVLETNDGRKGLLIDAFGVDADSVINEFILQVEEIQKKTEIRH